MQKFLLCTLMFLSTSHFAQKENPSSKEVYSYKYNVDQNYGSYLTNIKWKVLNYSVDENKNYTYLLDYKDMLVSIKMIKMQSQQPSIYLDYMRENSERKFTDSEIIDKRLELNAIWIENIKKITGLKKILPFENLVKNLFQQYYLGFISKDNGEENIIVKFNNGIYIHIIQFSYPLSKSGGQKTKDSIADFLNFLKINPLKNK